MKLVRRGSGNMNGGNMRFFLSVLLLIVNAPAWADWVKVGAVEKTVLFVNSESTVYFIDPSSITRDGSLRKVW